MPIDLANATAQSSPRLQLLKAQKFAAVDRQQRIAASLAALDSPQPTNLSIAKWKEIVEEIEDED